MNDRNHDFGMATYSLIHDIENLLDLSRERDGHLLKRDLPELLESSQKLTALIDDLMKGTANEAQRSLPIELPQERGPAGS